MPQPFRIYIDRLKAGNREDIEESVPAEFLDVREKELSFPDPVAVLGETYLTDDHLVIHLKIKTSAQMPCSICNNNIKIPIAIDDFYHVEPLAEIRTSVFDYTENLRESILLQVPPFTECKANCPERENLNKFLKKQKTETSKIVTHFPFADL